jgi:glycerophosphoryl diester phosphodiesterase
LIYLIFFWQWGKNCQPFYNKDKTLIFGHRGSPLLITENTLPSFQKAIDQEVDGLEFDIRLSADGQIVIFHDSDLSRLSKQSDKIRNLSLAELQAVELHGSENQLQGVYIPSLNDIIPLFDYIKVLNIEIKSDGFFKEHDILKPLINFLNKYQIDDRCIISSFNPFILMRLRLQRPETVIGFLYNRKRLFHGWDNMIWMLRVQPENLHIHYSMLNHWIVQWARNKGMHINSYTINDKKVFDSADIDGVFTDNIEYLK